MGGGGGAGAHIFVVDIQLDAVHRSGHLHTARARAIVAVTARTAGRPDAVHRAGTCRAGGRPASPKRFAGLWLSTLRSGSCGKFRRTLAAFTVSPEAKVSSTPSPAAVGAREISSSWY